MSILELKQGHRSILHVYGALVAIVSYVSKENRMTLGHCDRYHVIIWRIVNTHQTQAPMAHVNNDTPTSQDVATIIVGGKQTTDTEWATLKAARSRRRGPH